MSASDESSGAPLPPPPMTSSGSLLDRDDVFAVETADDSGHSAVEAEIAQQPRPNLVVDPSTAATRVPRVADAAPGAAVRRPATGSAGRSFSLADFYTIMDAVVEMEGSDIHIRSGETVMFRHLLEMKRCAIPGLDGPVSSESVDHLREHFFDLVPGNHRALLDQEGWVDFSLTYRDAVIRGNAFNEVNGPAIELRFFQRRYLSLDFLDLQLLVRFLQRRRGLVLVTGFTGAGKTTSLGAMIEYLNANYHVHIATLEDPIEVRFGERRARITQRSIPLHVRSFSSALKSILRQDPDVLMVGEIRDLDVLRTCLHGAETGHLVLSTMHARSVVGCIERIVLMFPSHEQEQAASLLGSLELVLVNQELLPGADGKSLVLGYEVFHSCPALSVAIRDRKFSQLTHIMRIEHDMKEWTSRLDDLLRLGRISRSVYEEHVRG